jgi:hypothetical protein
MMVTTAVVERAIDRLDQFGLGKGGYGPEDGPCCTIGHIVWASGEGDQPGTRTAARNIVHDAWLNFQMGRGGRRYGGVITWSDAADTTAEDVRCFYEWWSDELKAAG